MQFSTSLISFVTFFFTLNILSCNEINYYGTLIREVSKEYNRGSVIVVSTTHLPFDRIEVWAEVTRKLSSEGISILVINLENLEERLEVYMQRGDQLPLLVTIIDTTVQLERFRSFAENTDMSYGTWLIFFGESSDVCQFCRQPEGNPLNLKFNSKVIVSCCNTTRLEEWWSNKKDHVATNEVGRLTDDDQTIAWIPDTSMEHRRLSMGGQPLRLVSMKCTGLGVKYGDIEGFLGEVLEAMILAINFTIPKDGIIWENQIGHLQPGTSSWNGVIGRIVREEADLAVSGFVMNPDRNKVVQFTSPYSLGGYYLYFKKLDSAVTTSDAYYKVFNIEVWIGIVVLILVGCFFLTQINYKKTKSSFLVALLEQSSSVWGAYCNQGLSGLFDGSPSKITQMSLLLSALLIVTAYSAMMMSTLAVSSVYAPFTTVQEFVEDGSYKLIVENGSGYADMFQDSHLTVMKQMLSLLKSPNMLPHNPERAFEQVCRDRVVFYSHEITKNRLAHMIPCELSSIKFEGGKPISFFMPRGSEYLNVVNYHLEQMGSAGVIQRLEHKHFNQLKHLQDGQYPSVELQQVASLFYIVAAGFVVSYIILIIERICGPRKNVNRKQNIAANLPPIHPYCN